MIPLRTGFFPNNEHYLHQKQQEQKGRHIGLAGQGKEQDSSGVQRHGAGLAAPQMCFVFHPLYHRFKQAKCRNPRQYQSIARRYSVPLSSA